MIRFVIKKKKKKKKCEMYQEQRDCQSPPPQQKKNKEEGKGLNLETRSGKTTFKTFWNENEEHCNCKHNFCI
jgi:hypothetical protein